MKRGVAFLLAICMTLTFCPLAYAAQAKTPEKIYTYEDQFSDVPVSSKYAQYVQTVYEYGLMSGKSDTVFDLEGALSISDAIKAVCNLRASHYKDSAEISTGSMQDYISYALKNKIINESDEYAYDAPITRSVFALLISNATSGIQFQQINEIGEGDIPSINPFN